MSADFSFSGPLGQAIGLALLHALWQGAIVAVALVAKLGTGSLVWLRPAFTMPRVPRRATAGR